VTNPLPVGFTRQAMIGDQGRWADRPGRIDGEIRAEGYLKEARRLTDC
jgi:hypothetical protein